MSMRRDILEPVGIRNTDHKFAIANFDEPTMCLHCSKFLKGLIHQGYKCSVCTIAVHRGCMSSTGRCNHSAMPTDGLMPPPVCDRQLSEFYWFVGEMDRETASTRLESRKIGTYLLRVRPQGASNAMETMYALSLKYVFWLKSDYSVDLTTKRFAGLAKKLSNIWKSTRNVRTKQCCIICLRGGTLRRLSSWCRFTSETTWERISQGTYLLFYVYNV